MRTKCHTKMHAELKNTNILITPVYIIVWVQHVSTISDIHTYTCGVIAIIYQLWKEYGRRKRSMGVSMSKNLALASPGKRAVRRCLLNVPLPRTFLPKE